MAFGFAALASVAGWARRFLLMILFGLGLWRPGILFVPVGVTLPCVRSRPLVFFKCPQSLRGLLAPKRMSLPQFLPQRFPAVAPFFFFILGLVSFFRLIRFQCYASPGSPPPGRWVPRPAHGVFRLVGCLRHKKPPHL